LLVCYINLIKRSCLVGRVHFLFGNLKQNSPELCCTSLLCSATLLHTVFGFVASSILCQWKNNIHTYVNMNTVQSMKQICIEGMK